MSKTKKRSARSKNTNAADWDKMLKFAAFLQSWSSLQAAARKFGQKQRTMYRWKMALTGYGFKFEKEGHGPTKYRLVKRPKGWEKLRKEGAPQTMWRAGDAASTFKKLGGVPRKMKKAKKKVTKKTKRTPLKLRARYVKTKRPSKANKPKTVKAKPKHVRKPKAPKLKVVTDGGPIPAPAAAPAPAA